MKLYPFYTALNTLYELYGVELDEDTFENFAINAYRKIGNLIAKTDVLHICPEQDCNGSWFIQMPCGFTEIEAITTSFEDAQSTSSIRNHNLAYTQPIEEEIEHNKHFKNNLYLPGKFVKYTEVGDKLYFSEPYGVLNVLYKKQLVDDNDLPYITEAEAEAIATYCAYCYFYKRGLSTKDSGTIQMAQLLKKDWDKQCSQARIKPLSQNEINEILDVLASQDRHMYGRSTKPIK